MRRLFSGRCSAVKGGEKGRAGGLCAGSPASAFLAPLYSVVALSGATQRMVRDAPSHFGQSECGEVLHVEPLHLSLLFPFFASSSKEPCVFVGFRGVRMSDASSSSSSSSTPCLGRDLCSCYLLVYNWFMFLLACLSCYWLSRFHSRSLKDVRMLVDGGTSLLSKQIL